MTEEIKEILESSRKIIKSNRENGFDRIIMLGDDIDKLSDYITNLQQENKEYSMIFDTFSKRPYAHKYLEEKKKELNNNKIICLDSEMVYKDYYDYKSRCEKAIPMLKELNAKLKKILNIGIDIKEISDIEKILEVGDDNE